MCIQMVHWVVEVRIHGRVLLPCVYNCVFGHTLTSIVVASVSLLTFPGSTGSRPLTQSSYTTQGRHLVVRRYFPASLCTGSRLVGVSARRLTFFGLHSPRLALRRLHFVGLSSRDHRPVSSRRRTLTVTTPLI